jgi:hypothetical protein
MIGRQKTVNPHCSSSLYLYYSNSKNEHVRSGRTLVFGKIPWEVPACIFFKSILKGDLWFVVHRRLLNLEFLRIPYKICIAKSLSASTILDVNLFSELLQYGIRISNFNNLENLFIPATFNVSEKQKI